MQRKRIHISSALVGAAAEKQLLANVDETNGVNFHNVHFGFAVEPQDADANANGTWVLYCIPDAVSTVPTSSQGVLEAEGSNPFIWAMGVWTASNQSPYTSGDMVIRSSRNCPRDGRLIMVVRMEGVSAGTVRTLQYLTYNTKSL